MRRNWRQIAGLAFLLVFHPGLAHACSCIGPGPQPCRLLLKESTAIFVGTVVEIENPPDPDPKASQAGQARYTFAVSERFAGTARGEVVVYSGRGGADCSYHFQKGEQYLVYAYNMDDQTLHASICSRTQPTMGAEVLLRQLRAAKEGKQVASLYGVLSRTQQPYESTFHQDYDRPMPGTTVRLRGKSGRVFATKTNDSGEYAFYSLPRDDYQVSADLPRNLIVAQTILSNPPAPINLPAQSCYQYDIEAMPRTRIIGHLVGPDGRFTEGSVELFSEEVVAQQKKRGWWEYAKAAEGFRFDRVAPGNYILIFNNSNQIDPDAPYPRTFYPGVTDPARASLIHVTEDDRDIIADIHLSGGEETSEVTVRVEWTGVYKTGKDDTLYLNIQSDIGDSPSPSESGNGFFSVRLLKRATYTVRGSVYCASGKDAETGSVIIHGSDVFSAPIVLRLPENACVK
jgi:hypothetical protein